MTSVCMPSNDYFLLVAGDVCTSVHLAFYFVLERVVYMPSKD